MNELSIAGMLPGEVASYDPHARTCRVRIPGITDGSIPPLEPQATAQTLYQLWLGASLIGKLHRNASALENAMAFTRKLLS